MMFFCRRTILRILKIAGLYRQETWQYDQSYFQLAESKEYFFDLKLKKYPS